MPIIFANIFVVGSYERVKKRTHKSNGKKKKKCKICSSSNINIDEVSNVAMKKIKKKKQKNGLKTYKIARSTFVLNIEKKNKQNSKYKIRFLHEY